MVRSCVSAPAGRAACNKTVSIFQRGVAGVFTLLNALFKRFKLRWKSGRLSCRVGQI